MLPLYAISLFCVMLPVTLYLSHVFSIPLSNIMFSFGIACCSSIMSHDKKMSLPSYSLPLTFLCLFVLTTWNINVLIGASMVCAATYFITLLVCAKRVKRNLTYIINHHLVSIYYFTLSCMLLCVALSMIVDNIVPEHIVTNSMYTVFIVCTVSSVFSAICFAILPKKLKIFTFAFGLIFGMWLFNRTGVLVAPIGSALVNFTSQIPSDFLVKYCNVPELLPEVVKANFEYYLHIFNSQAMYVYPTFIKPTFALEPCAIMGVAGIFLAAEYTLNAYTSATLRAWPVSHFFHSRTILIQGFIALISAVFTGVPLTLSAEGNAIRRIIHFDGQKALFVLGLLCVTLAFLGKPLWFIEAIRFPILGTQFVLLASYFLFTGLVFFPNRSTLFDLAICFPMVLLTFLFPTYFMFPGLPIPPVWICLVIGIVANLTSRSAK